MKSPTAFLELESFALYNNAEGDFNTANGAFALVANTTGERNTATGDSALFSNNIGNRNTAIGNAALGLNTTAPTTRLYQVAFVRANRFIFVTDPMCFTIETGV
jgi:hypothetical protein